MYGVPPMAYSGTALLRHWACLTNAFLCSLGACSVFGGRGQWSWEGIFQEGLLSLIQEGTGRWRRLQGKEGMGGCPMGGGGGIYRYTQSHHLIYGTKQPESAGCGIMRIACPGRVVDLEDPLKKTQSCFACTFPKLSTSAASDLCAVDTNGGTRPHAPSRRTTWTSPPPVPRRPLTLPCAWGLGGSCLHPPPPGLYCARARSLRAYALRAQRMWSVAPPPLALRPGCMRRCSTSLPHVL